MIFFREKIRNSIHDSNHHVLLAGTAGRCLAEAAVGEGRHRIRQGQGQSPRPGILPHPPLQPPHPLKLLNHLQPPCLHPASQV